MKILIFFQITFLSIFFVNESNAQILNEKTVTEKVYGNCGMCKKTIEKAAFKSNVSSGVWDEELAHILITFDSTKTNVDEILKKIAAVGYDSDKFTAPDKAYDKLHGCCKYDRPVKNTVLPKGDN